MAAISWPSADPHLAGGNSGCAAFHRAGGSRFYGCGQLHQQRLAAHAYGLSAYGQEHRSGRHRVSRRGYQILAIDIEGTEACDWLTSRGITCILSKYRVPGEGVLPKSGAYPASREALDDAQRTVSLVRFHAAEWHLDPHRIGVLGFSAGGHIVAALSVHFGQRIYAPVDAADKVSCRPDFAVALYPGHLSLERGTIRLTPDIRDHVTAQTPPTFLLQNEDDHVDSVEDSLSYFFALKKAGVPVELHVYAHGGHAFGLRPTKFPATHWPALVETWLHTIGILPGA